MGHYLSEMEDDGVPRNWKVGRTTQTRDSKYSILKLAATSNMLEKITGSRVETSQVELFLDQWAERSEELQPLREQLQKATDALQLDIITKIKNA